MKPLMLRAGQLWVHMFIAQLVEHRTGIARSLILADTTEKLMRRTQLKKEPNRMKIACGGVEEFCN